jgi:hypothetical protein
VIFASFGKSRQEIFLLSQQENARKVFVLRKAMQDIFVLQERRRTKLLYKKR